MALTAKKVYAILKRQISNMEAKLNSPVRYRGTVATADLLPLNPDIGDMYNIESKSVYGEAGMNVAWNGVVWDTMGAPIDMSLYLTKEEAETVIQRLVTEYFEKNPVKPGATEEQAQQIEQNKTDIASLKAETGSLKEDISKIQNKFEFDIEMNIHGILNASPSDSTYIGYSDDENARCSDYIDCQNFKYISAKCNGSEWSWVIAFFNANKLFLPDISIIGVAGKRTYEVEIPESAKYVRISTYNADISYFAKIMFSKKT